MRLPKAISVLGIFLIVLSFLAAPSFGAVGTLDPTLGQTGDVEIEKSECDAECQVDDACPCTDEWNNHGDYVNCVAQKVKELYQAGEVTEDEGSAIISLKAKGDCGKSPKGQQNKKK